MLFGDNQCSIKHLKTGNIVMTVKKNECNVYPAEFSKYDQAHVVSVENQSLLWHRRLGHLGFQGIQFLQQRNLVLGLPKMQKFEKCEACIHGKLARFPFPTGRSWRAKQKWQLIHADVCGPMQNESHGGKRYFLLFVDDLTRMCWIHLLRNKFEVFGCFKKFIALVERQTDLKVKVLRTDRGGEFLSKDFTMFCDGLEIKHELTAPYTPQQNGVAERISRTLVEKARSTMNAMNLPVDFWAEAAVTAGYLSNVSPTRAVYKKTPHEVWFGKKPYVDHLRVFGCVVFTHVQNQQKLDSRVEKGIFVGYAQDAKAYRVFNPVTNKIIISRDMVFMENITWTWTANESTTEKFFVPDVLSDSSVSEGVSDSIQQNVSAEEQSDSNISRGQTIERGEPEIDVSPIQKVRSLRKIYESCSYALTVSDPVSNEEAQKSENWQKAIVEEIQAIQKNGTWNLCLLPSEMKVIGEKWIFKTMYKPNGDVEKYKAPLVAKGYAQEYGIDYEEVFASVAKLDTVRILLALAAFKGWPVYHLDVKSAFLNGNIEEEVYVA